jgi:phosphatidylserine decarboxylase
MLTTLRDIIENIRVSLPAIHKEGHIFIILFIVGTMLFFVISNKLGWFGIVLTLWCICFFRDPERVTPLIDGAVISPADGIVQMIAEAAPPTELEMGDEEMTRISIFLNVFDVHVNRTPIEGKVKKLHYRPGKFLNASLDKASVDNERQSVLIETKEKHKIAVVQIAGLIARRIVCDLKAGQKVLTGERFGIIRFGSRVDIYLPKGIAPQVVVGQYMIGGETIIANLKGDQQRVDGEIR